MRLIIQKNNENINTIDDWRLKAAPADSVKHWKDGRSAKEMARFTFTGEFEGLIASILNELGIYEEVYYCEPEAKTYFGRGFGKGGPRNHDLLMCGENSVIGVEAKVSESYDELISKKSVHRVNALMKYLCGVDTPSDVDKENLYYQLLTASVGTIKAAVERGKDKAVVLFITFTGNVSKERNYEQKININTDAFSYFQQKLKLDRNGKLQDVPGVKGKFECWIRHITVDINTSYLIK